MGRLSETVKFNCDRWLDKASLPGNEGTLVKCSSDGGADVGVKRLCSNVTKCDGSRVSFIGDNDGLPVGRSEGSSALVGEIIRKNGSSQIIFG